MDPPASTSSKSLVSHGRPVTGPRPAGRPVTGPRPAGRPVTAPRPAGRRVATAPSNILASTPVSNLIVDAGIRTPHQADFRKTLEENELSPGMIRRGDVAESELRNIGVSLGTCIRLRNINTLDNGSTLNQASGSVVSKLHVRAEAVGSNRVSFAASAAVARTENEESSIQPMLQDLTSKLDSKQSANVSVHSASGALKFRHYYNNNVKAQDGVLFDKESADNIAINTMNYLLAENSVASSSKHAYMKLLLRVFKYKGMTVSARVREEVTRMMSILHAELTKAHTANEQKATQAVTEKDVLHLINSALLEQQSASGATGSKSKSWSCCWCLLY